MTAPEKARFVGDPIRGRWRVRLEFKLEDCWVGAFWKRDGWRSFHLWVCLVPMLPIHFSWAGPAVLRWEKSRSAPSLREWAGEEERQP